MVIPFDCCPICAANPKYQNPNILIKMQQVKHAYFGFGFDKYYCANCKQFTYVSITVSQGFFAQQYQNQVLNRVEMKKCIYKYTHNRSIVEVTFKGDFKTFIEPAKSVLMVTVPATNRSYDPLTKVWEMAIEYWATYRSLLETMKCHFEELKEVEDSLSDIEVPPEYAANFFHEQAPIITVESTESIAAKLSQYLGVTIATQELSELKTLYRQKARQLHPDLGGDAKDMSELNRLWTLYTAQDRMVN